MPCYVEGPYDDPRRVLATLERAVGRGGYHYIVSLGDVDEPDDDCRNTILAVVSDALNNAA